MERLPGFRDFYPEPLPASEGWSAELREHLFAVWRGVARRYGFREYDGPPLEPLELFTVKSGDEIVRQLYHFTDKGERAVALRPEMTPTLARMVALRERNYRKPMKWFAIPQLFRYEKQQRGRLREHFQLNADIFGEAGPGADAELIALLIDSLRGLGLGAEDFVVRLSSRRAWQEFYRVRGGEGAREYDFFQVVDKLEREEPEVSGRQLQELGLELGEVRAFIEEGRPTAELQGILDSLAARGMSGYVRVDYGVIRGLAYYTGPVFEAFDRQGEFRAIAGGGRYDELVKRISGGKVDLPGLGFGMGDVVLTELLRRRGKVPRLGDPLDVYCLIEDEGLRGETLRLAQALRDGGLGVEYALAAAKGDRQFKRALELGARWTCRVERGESGEVRVRLRCLATREEQVLPVEEGVLCLVRNGRTQP
jgi:histidyl-tRNA synthetase